MFRRMTVTLVAGLLLGIAPALAQDAGGPADDAPVYGRQLMTQEEAQQYRERMRNADTAEERARIRAEHHQNMQARAREQGVELAPMGERRGMGPGSRTDQGMGQGAGMYGQQLMTQQEMQQYRERMRNADTAEERARIRAEHRQDMQARARQQGVELPDPAQQRGMGSGMGKGPGMQSGSSMGHGGAKGGGRGGGKGGGRD